MHRRFRGHPHHHPLHRHGPDCPHHRFHRVHPRLQRRVFLWFGASIVFTAVVVGLLFRLLSPTEQWHRDAQGLQHFVGKRVEQIWDDPVAREQFVHDLHRDLRLDAALRDRSGRVIAVSGAICEDPWAVVPVMRDGRRVGRLEVCGDRAYDGGGWRFLLILAVACMILWAASGIFARRLLRPLRRLEELARKIGEGDLSARSNLTPQRHGELGMLGVTLDEMAARIEKQLADQRELLAAVSHELRTPLGHLRVLLEMAREKPEQARVDDIEAEVLEVDALVGQLLASSRIEFGTLERRKIDVVEIAERALERIGKPTDLVKAAGPIECEADPTLLARALANLLANAEVHGKGVRAVVVRAEHGQVIYAVEDRGPGFGKSEREKVFEPFYRGEHRAGASLGLGLSLVRRIAEAHGGRAWIEDVEGGGARVLFSISTLPAEERAVAL
jgi:two-component system, OmpR family, sensor kinase